jgi:hypothetical protein
MQPLGGRATETARGAGHNGDTTCEILNGRGGRHGVNLSAEVRATEY